MTTSIDRENQAERGARGVSRTFIAVCVAVLLLAIAFFAFYEPTGNTFTPWPRNASTPQTQA
jgi:type II secretory pathway component PulM